MHNYTTWRAGFTISPPGHPSSIEPAMILAWCRLETSEQRIRNSDTIWRSVSLPGGHYCLSVTDFTLRRGTGRLIIQEQGLRGLRVMNLETAVCVNVLRGLEKITHEPDPSKVARFAFNCAAALGTPLPHNETFRPEWFMRSFTGDTKFIAGHVDYDVARAWRMGDLPDIQPIECLVDYSLNLRTQSFVAAE